MTKKNINKEFSNKTRLAKAQQPSKISSQLHKFYNGKIAVISKCAVRSLEDFSYWYTPGVASPCMEIFNDVKKVFDYTNKGNFVAIVSDGTRVLGLGDIGPESALPVMEGKALIFKYLGGVDAFPIVLNTKEPDEIVKTIKNISPSFGGINLEDIAQPKCFYILDKLRQELQLPVWHDDQQGTATVTVAGLINALKIVNKNLCEVKIAMIGAGAANMRIAKMIISAGANVENIIMVDSKGILNPDRKDLEEKQLEFKEKWEMCLKSNADRRKGGIPEAIKNTDVLIAASKPGPETIKKEWIRTMKKNAIVFAEANPVPEIWPWDAKEAGARIVATGRSDFPNQVNNSLGFPAIFRGTLDVRAKTITDEMCLAAAEALAEYAEKKGNNGKGINEDYIIPTMEEWEVFPKEAVAVGLKAIEQGIAEIKLTEKELLQKAEKIISTARKEINLLMKEGLIQNPPKY